MIDQKGGLTPHVPESDAVLKVGLTSVETQVLDIAMASAISHDYSGGLEQAMDIVTSTGCAIEMTTSGSDQNKGRFCRNRHFPHGQISLMNVPGDDTSESVLRELVHEFLYLQLHKLSLPDLNDIHDSDKLESAAHTFAAGLGPRLCAEIEFAQTIENDKKKDRYIGNRERMLEKIGNEKVALKMANDFLLWH